jgi:hypothetical protein
VEKFYSICNEFLEHFLMLMHILSEKPARGMERCTLQYSNTMFRTRELVILDSNLMSVAAYNKSSAISGMSEFICRFLPPQIAKLYVAFTTIQRLQLQLSELICEIVQPHQRLRIALVSSDGKRGNISTGISCITVNLRPYPHLNNGIPYSTLHSRSVC